MQRQRAIPGHSTYYCKCAQRHRQLSSSWQLGTVLQKPRTKVEAVIGESPHLLSKLKFLPSLICGKWTAAIFTFP